MERLQNYKLFKFKIQVISQWIMFFCRDSLILSRRYILSGNTYITIGINVNESLNSEVKVLLHNKNEFIIPLTRESITNLFEDNLKRRLKSYFEKKLNSTDPVVLDDVTTLNFVKVYEKPGISIHNSVKNVQICFLGYTWENLSNLRYLINCYTAWMESSRRMSVEKKIPKVKEVFQNYYYHSHRDP